MKKLIFSLSLFLLLNAENLDEMCQNEGDIRANLTSCYKAAVKIYNSSSDDKEFCKVMLDIKVIKRHRKVRLIRS